MKWKVETSMEKGRSEWRITVGQFQESTLKVKSTRLNERSNNWQYYSFSLNGYLISFTKVAGEMTNLSWLASSNITIRQGTLVKGTKQTQLLRSVFKEVWDKSTHLFEEKDSCQVAGLLSGQVLTNISIPTGNLLAMGYRAKETSHLAIEAQRLYNSCSSLYKWLSLDI